MENDAQKKIFGMIGLSRRAGKLTFGSDAVLKDIAERKAKAAFISNDASERTAAKIKDACLSNKLSFAVLPVSKEALGRAIGRIDTAVIAVCDKSFAGRIIELADAGSDSARQGQPDSGGN